MGLDKITVPTLIVYHKDDECFGTSAEDAPKIKEGLIHAKKADILYFTGGNIPESDSCQPMSQHGFYGIEGQVVAATAEFIKSNAH